MIAPSVVDIGEEQLVGLLHEPGGPWRHIAIPPLTEWPVSVRQRVTPKQLGLPTSSFGDIDALVIPKGDFSNARAVQYKRIKIPSAAFLTGEPNGLQKLRKAIRQSNELVQLGLAHVWLEVIVVVDARDHAGGRYVVAAPQSLLNRVYEAMPIASLDARAGLVITEIVQSVDRPVAEAGGFGGHMVRPAIPQEQPEALTAAIAALFAQAA